MLVMGAASAGGFVTTRLMKLTMAVALDLVVAGCSALRPIAPADRARRVAAQAFLDRAADGVWRPVPWAGGASGGSVDDDGRRTEK